MGDGANRLVVQRAIARFRENSRGFWGVYRWVLIIFVASLLCDAASTTYFMVRTGPEMEINPLVRIASKLFGPIVGPLFGAMVKTVGGIMVAIYFRRFAAYLLILVSLISLWAAWYNIWGIEMYSPMFMRWLP